MVGALALWPSRAIPRSTPGRRRATYWAKYPLISRITRRESDQARVYEAAKVASKMVLSAALDKLAHSNSVNQSREREKPGSGRDLMVGSERRTGCPLEPSQPCSVVMNGTLDELGSM
jgi:hypothetical protein